MVIFFIATTAFIAFYLYHVIKDLKRVDSDVKQVATDVNKLTQDIQSLAKLVQVNRASVVVAPIVSDPLSVPMAPVGEQLSPQEEAEDDDSVNTEELKQILVDDDEDEDENEDDNEVYESQQTQEHTPSLEELKKLKYDDIKDLCKKRGISIKGSKEQLIAKLSGSDN